MIRRLIVHETDPLNAEAPLAALSDPLTPVPLFYVRSHGPVPRLDKTQWRLAVDGAVAQPLSLGWEDLQSLPARRVVATMECAGNGRALMSRPVEGTAWGLGATGTASFGGAALSEVLRRAGLRPEAVEILFTGADRSEVAPGRTEGFRRSLPVREAHGDDLLLAWTMNDDELAHEHGYPLRLVAPGWYGMASVKWLTGITALTQPFEGYYQTERYVYQDEHAGAAQAPVTRIRVRSVIARPAEGDRVPLGVTEIAGTAWSGSAPIEGVEISADGGSSWARAEMQQPAGAAAAVAWRFAWLPPAAGRYTLIARAADRSGNVQPLEPLWNRYGYGNNVAQRVTVEVVG